MSRRVSWIAVVAIIAVLALASFGSAFAQTGTGSQTQNQGQAQNQGTGPENAMAASGTSRTLNAGQQHFYAFRYSGDRSNIEIRLSSQPQNAVAFDVWTPGNLREWQSGGQTKAIGGGSANKALNGDMTWSGNFTSNGTYFVAVRNISQAQASYNLQIQGSGVIQGTGNNQQSSASGTQQSAVGASNTSGTASTSASGTGSQQASSPNTLPVTGARLQTGTGNSGTSTTKQTGTSSRNPNGNDPGSALSPSGQFVNASNGLRWYGFRYQGGGSQVSIRMQQSGASCGFEVYTPEAMRLWQGGQAGNQAAQNGAWPQGQPTVQPVGRGTSNSAMGGDLFWSGSFAAGGNYSVLVNCAGSGGTQASAAGRGSYYFQVFGTGLSFANGQAAPLMWQSATSAGTQTSSAAGQTQQSASTSGAPTTLPVTGGVIN